MADGVDLYDRYVESQEQSLSDALDKRVGQAEVAGSLCALAVQCLKHRKDERIGLAAVLLQLDDLSTAAEAAEAEAAEKAAAAAKVAAVEAAAVEAAAADAAEEVEAKAAAAVKAAAEVVEVGAAAETEAGDAVGRFEEASEEDDAAAVDQGLAQMEYLGTDSEALPDPGSLSATDLPPSPPIPSAFSAPSSPSSPCALSPPLTPTSASSKGLTFLQEKIADAVFSSGNSHIVDAEYVIGQERFSSEVQQLPVKVKFSNDLESLERELYFLKRLRTSQSSCCIDLVEDHVVSAAKMEFHPDDKFPSSHSLSSYGGLVMRSGAVDLKTYLYKCREDIPKEELLTIAIKVVEIVAAIHKYNVAWMDVKPQNFVQVGGGQYRTTWVAIDFDLARDLASSLPPDYCSVTWDYCPPEFARVGAAAAAARSPCTPEQFDVWALGMTVLEVLDGNFVSSVAADLADTMDKVRAIRLKLAALTDEDIKDHIKKRFLSTTVNGKAAHKFLPCALAVHPASRQSAQKLIPLLKLDNLNTTSNFINLVEDLHIDVKAVGVDVKAMEALVDSVEAGVGALQAGMDDQRAESKGIANMLRTLVRGEFSVPTLLLLLPAGRTSVGGKIKGFFMQKYKLCFLCPVTLMPGKDYTLYLPRDWLVKAMPVLQLSLLLVQVALAGVGIPPPAVTALGSVLGTSVGTPNTLACSLVLQDLRKQFAKKCAGMAEQGDVKDRESLSTEYVALLRDLGKTLGKKELQQQEQKLQEQQRLAMVLRLAGFTKECKQSYSATYDLLRKLENSEGTIVPNWKPTKTGLSLVTSEKDGTSAWVSEDAETQFHSEGADALILYKPVSQESVKEPAAGLGKG
ncbi:kinase-like domain-containing protein [Ochromonadaceae sp. CCMP2298]|nr:kinase-like domain-containing protein [Ochromonadaceae sp. CCMP2298]